MCDVHDNGGYCDYAEAWDDEQEHTVNAANAIADLLLAFDTHDTAQEKAYNNAARVLYKICNDNHDSLAEKFAPLLSHPTILKIIEHPSKDR